MSTRGVSLEQEGFIHCSLPHQLRAVAEAVYADADDLVVLVIDSARLPSPVRYEGADGGEQYPHVYGPVPADAYLPSDPGEAGSERQTRPARARPGLGQVRRARRSRRPDRTRRRVPAES